MHILGTEYFSDPLLVRRGEGKLQLNFQFRMGIANPMPPYKVQGVRACSARSQATSQCAATVLLVLISLGLAVSQVYALVKAVSLQQSCDCWPRARGGCGARRRRGRLAWRKPGRSGSSSTLPSPRPVSQQWASWLNPDAPTSAL